MIRNLKGITYQVASTLLVLGLSNQTFAGEWTSIFYSPRGMMLGNAMTAKVNDYSALFYNPAGLAGVETWKIQFPMDANIALSSNFANFVSQDLPALKTSIDAAATNGAAGASDFINQATRFINRSYVADVNIIPIGLTFKNFAINVIAGGNANISFLPTQLPTIDVRNRLQAGINVGYAMSFLEESLRVGIGAHVLGRFGVQQEIGFGKSLTNFTGGSGSLSNLLNVNDILNSAQTGIGYDFDLGTQYFLNLPQIPIMSVASKLKFGAVIQNVLNMDFVPLKVNTGTTTITKDSDFALDRTVNLGVAWALAPIFGFWRNEVSLDLRNLLRPAYARSIGTNLNFGYESILDFMSWLQVGARVGVNDGAYLTYGGMVRLGIITLEAGMYNAEMGGYPGQRGSPRVIGRFAFEI